MTFPIPTPASHLVGRIRDAIATARGILILTYLCWLIFPRFRLRVAVTLFVLGELLVLAAVALV